MTQQNLAGLNVAKVIWQIPDEEVEWEELEAIWDKQEEDNSFMSQVKRGQQGLNAGLDNGLKAINTYIHGTHRGRKILIGADSGVGKCLGKGTKVIMYDGTLKAVEDITIGDVLMGPDNLPRNVLSTCRGKEQMYWVRQKRGMDYRVNESHILSLVYRPQNKWTTTIVPGQEEVAKNKRKRTYKLLEQFESEVVNLSIKEYLATSNKLLYQGWKSPVDFNHVNRLLHLDPYFLGLWLGDGTSEGTDITTVDSEILSYLAQFASRYNLQLKLKDRITYTIVGKKGTKNPIRQLLRDYKVFGNKHIPFEYTQGSRDQKLLLVAGLIDSDGYYNLSNNMVEITQKRKILAEQLALVLRSLGFYTTIKEKTAKMNREDGSVYKCQVWKIAFSHCSSIPCRVVRKKAQQVNTKSLTTTVKVEKDIVDDYYGFVIDGDHLFLLEDFTVTHNTTLCDFMYFYSLWRDCQLKGIKLYIKYFSFELSAAEKKAKWVCQWVKALYNKDLSTDYVMGRIPNLLLSAEHLKLVQRAYSIVEEVMKDVTMVDHMLHPTGMFNVLVEEHYEKIGKVIRDEPKPGKKKGMIRKYIANDPSAMTLVITDHLALINGEGSAVTTKQIMDRWSMYGVQFRNIFGTTLVDIQQFSTNMMSAYREQKKTETAISPQRLDFGDSTYTYRDADLVLGLVKPIQYNLHKFGEYDIKEMGQYFIALYLMKNRYGPADRLLELFMNPITGMFWDMPEASNTKQMEHFINEAKRIESVCQAFNSPQGIPQ